MNIDQLLATKKLKYEDLEPEELETLKTWVQSLAKNPVTIESLKDYIVKMRSTVLQALSDVEETPSDWLSVFAMFFPLYGVIRKWYLDQKRVALTNRLKVYLMLELFLFSPEKVKAQIEKALESVKQ